MLCVYVNAVVAVDVVLLGAIDANDQSIHAIDIITVNSATDRYLCS